MLVGLTGGLGCGKSTVASYFRTLKWDVLDADQICHSLYETEEVILLIKNRWGSSVFSKGVLDRRKISKKVFNEKLELDWLNSVFHARIMAHANKVLENLSNKYVLFDVPLIYEAGWEKSFEYVITVWSDKITQTKRLINRGMSKVDIDKRLKSQMPIEEKLNRSYFGVINYDGLDLLYEQCKRIDNKIRN